MFIRFSILQHRICVSSGELNALFRTFMLIAHGFSILRTSTSDWGCSGHWSVPPPCTHDDRSRCPRRHRDPCIFRTGSRHRPRWLPGPPASGQRRGRTSTWSASYWKRFSRSLVNDFCLNYQRLVAWELRGEAYIVHRSLSFSRCVVGYKRSISTNYDDTCAVTFIGLR